MKDIALVLCCYNKREEAIRCIESVFASTVKNYDLVVVDNGSTDGSCDEIKNRFEGQLEVIRSDVNNGAGAGFNIGIKWAIERDCRYIMLLDHDIVLEKDTIEILHDFLETNPEAGAAQSKFCYMNNPQVIQFAMQEFDTENLRVHMPLNGALDDGSLPDVIYGDIFILGATMFRAEAIRSVGLLEESFFIYGEDFDWGLRFRKAGYKIACCMKARVLHEFGIATRKNTLATYYFRRNNMRFMFRYLSDDLVDKYCDKTLRDFFQGLYSCNYNKKFNTLKALAFALDDALNQVSGKAGPGRILESDKTPDRLGPALHGTGNIAVHDEISQEYLSYFRDMLRRVQSANPDAEITIATENADLKEQFPEIHILQDIPADDKNGFLTIRFCDHVFNVKEFDPKSIYFDVYNNLAVTPEDKEYCGHFESSYQFYRQCNLPVMKEKVKHMRMREGYFTRAIYG